MLKGKNLSKLLVKLLIVAFAITCVAGLIACDGKEKTYTVTFDPDNGSAPFTASVKSGKTVSAPTEPIKQGHAFIYWEKQDGSGAEFKFATETVTKNITLKAKWQINTYAVTFESNGGTAVEAQNVNYGGTVSRPSNPTKAGFVFEAWCEDAALTTVFDFSTVITAAGKTLYARYLTSTGQEFTVKFVGSEPAIADRLTNSDGILTNPPAATKAGSTFLGWWMSDFENPDKLTCEYTNQALEENTVLYAVWQSAGTAVSVNSTGISWNNKGPTASYRVVITPPSGTAEAPTNTNATRHDYDFAQKAMGEYKIEVTFDGIKTTVYYNNKALKKVSLFKVEGFSLIFNPVRNATNYSITVDCGDDEAAHASTHINHNNGTSTVFPFNNCIMTEDGINFTVTASATGYISSTSKTFNFKRRLNDVAGLTFEDATEQFKWNAVENATYYMVSIDDGAFARFDGLTYTSVKEHAPGNIKIQVYAVAHGFNPSLPVSLTHEKTNLATPARSSISIENEVISWTAITSAAGYKVKIGTEEFDSETNTMPVPAKFATQSTLEVSVKAISATAGQDSLYSEVRLFSASLAGLVDYASGVVSWAPVRGATGYDVMLNGTEIATKITASEKSVTFTTAGTQTIKVRFYDSGNNASEWETITVTAYAVTLRYNIADHGNFRVLYKANGDTLDLPNDATYAGYGFMYWSISENGTKYETLTLTSAAELTLYARWSPNEYTILFSHNGTMTETSGKVYYREHYTLPTPASLDAAKVFDGWYSSASGEGTRYTNAAGKSINIWTPLAGATMYARWLTVLSFKTLGDGTLAVSKTSSTNSVTTITIPSKYNNVIVSTIEDGAFSDCSNLRVINIHNTMSSIATGADGGNSTGSAFIGCTNLLEINVIKVDNYFDIKYTSENGALIFFNDITSATELKYFPFGISGEYTVPDIVSTLPINVFKGTRITKVNIPYSVKAVDTKVFANCTSLSEIVFLPTPSDKTAEGLKIDTDVFIGCTSLTTITLPARFKEFSLKIFASSTRLTHINIEAGGIYSSVDGLLCADEGKTLIYCPQGRGGKLTIPNVTAIADDAFSNPIDGNDAEGNPIIIYKGTELTSITIPGNVKSIGKSAFRGNTQLSELIFNGGNPILPLTIDEEAFYGCWKLTSLVLPADLRYLNAYAFGGILNLKTVTVNGQGALEYAPAAFGTIPTDTESSIYYVTDVILGANTGVINFPAVFGPNVKSVSANANNPNYSSDDGVLYDKDKTRIVFFPSAKTGPYVVPTSVTAISDNIFNGKTGLTSITIHKGVKSIGISAFSGCRSLSQVIFTGESAPASPALTIGDYAFNGCTALQNFVLPDYVTTIGSHAFDGCNGSSFTAINIPSSVTTIGAYAFLRCSNLSTITLNEGLTRIGDYAFSGCSKVQTITLPSTLTTLSLSETTGLYNTFENCNSLRSISVNGENANFASSNGILYGKTGSVVTSLIFCPVNANANGGLLDISKTVTKIWPRAFYRNTGITDIDFSQGVDGLLTIGAEVFYNCTALETVALPAGLKTINSNLFYNCTALIEVVIPNTVTRMEVNVFVGCSSLSTITFAEGGTEKLVLAEGGAAGSSYVYYDGVFVGLTALTEIELPERLETISDYAFAPYITGRDTAVTSNLKKVIIPSSVTRIGSYAFFNAEFGTSKLEEISFVGTSKLESIGVAAFQNCENLTRISFPASLTSIEEYAFNASSIEKRNKISSLSFAAGSRLNTIGARAFANGVLTGITLPTSLSNINTYAFSDNTSLLTVSFSGNGIRTIGSYAFNNCPALQPITLPASLTSIGSYAFNGCSSLTSLTFATYTSGDNQGKASFNTASQRAFANMGLEQRLEFPESINDISLGANLFEGTKKLTSVYLSKSVKSIGTAFNKSFVKTIQIADGHESFSADRDYPILYNAGGTTVILTFGGMEITGGTYRIADSVTVIDANAFKNQVYIEKIIIPATVTTIGSYAFANCYDLKEVIFETTDGTEGGVSNINSFGTNVFENCSALTTINMSRVTEIKTLPAYTFNNCYSLTDITLLESLEVINAYAFNYCTSLTSINIPNSVTAIRANAFSNSGLMSISLPSSLSSLSDSVFQYSSLKNVTFNSNVASFGASVFAGCAQLQTANLYSTMTLLGSNVFQNCTALSLITYGGNTTGKSALPSGVTSVGAYAFNGCTSLTDLSLPGVTSLGALVFNNSGITALSLPSLTSLPNNAFYDNENLVGNANLKSITVSANLTSVGTSAFQNCTNLDTITFAGNSGGNAFPTRTTTINSKAFLGCTSLKTLSLLGVTTLGTNAFEGCSSLNSITLNSALTAIGSTAFRGATALKTINLPASLLSIGTNAFQNSGLTSIEIPEGVVNFGTLITDNVYTFSGCASLASVTLPSGLKTIGGYMFQNCSSLSVITYKDYGGQGNAIPATATLVGAYAFAGCTSLTNLSLPGIETAGTNMFNGCRALSCVTLNNALAILSANMFQNCTELKAITLPAGITAIPTSAFQGSGLTSFNITEAMESIGNSAFAGCKNLETFVVDSANTHFSTNVDGILFDSDNNIVCVPAGLSGAIDLTGVSEIKPYAFYECTNITGITFSPSLRTIGAYAFYGTTGLTAITLPSSLNSVGAYAFANSGLQSVTVEGTTLGANMFEGCKSLTAVNLDDSTTTLGNYMFSGASALEAIVLPSGLINMGTNTFSNSGIKEIVIPDRVVHLGNGNEVTDVATSSYVFANARSLTKVTLSANLRTMGSNAFLNTTALKTITYTGNTSGVNALPDSLKFIASNAFRNTGLESIHIPNVTTLGAYIFAGSSLVSVTFDDNLTGLSGLNDGTGHMFADCANLRTVTLPENLTYLGRNTFLNSGIQSIVIPERVFHLGAIKNSAGTISNSANVFENCASLTTVVLPSNLLSIGTNAFRGCSNLTTLTYAGYNGEGNAIPKSVTQIGNNAFYGSGIEEITLFGNISPTSVIGSNVFASSGLKTITLKGDYIPATMFQDCALLTTVIFETDGITIGDYAFKNCVSLTDIVIPENSAIGLEVFSGLADDKTIYVVDSFFNAMCIWTNATGSTAGWLSGCNANFIWGYVPQSES